MVFCVRRAGRVVGRRPCFPKLGSRKHGWIVDQAEHELVQYAINNRNYQTSVDPVVRLKGMRLEAEFKLRQQLVLTLAMSREQSLLDEKNDIPILNILDPASLPLEKSRPSRATLAILAFFLFSAGSFGLENLPWIRRVLVRNVNWL